MDRSQRWLGHYSSRHPTPPQGEGVMRACEICQRFVKLRIRSLYPRAHPGGESCPFTGLEEVMSLDIADFVMTVRAGEELARRDDHRAAAGRSSSVDGFLNRLRVESLAVRDGAGPGDEKLPARLNARRGEAEQDEQREEAERVHGGRQSARRD